MLTPSTSNFGASDSEGVKRQISFERLLNSTFLLMFTKKKKNQLITHAPNGHVQKKKNGWSINNREKKIKS